MSSIDWRRTLTYLALFISILGMSVYFFSPTEAELEQRGYVQPTIPQERITVAFDNRTWQVSREVKQDSKLSVEYVPQGDTLPDWKEIVTIQAFGGLQDKGTPEEFAAVIEKHIRDWGGDKVTWNTLAISDDDLVYEWQIKGKENTADQYEMCRIVKGSSGFHLVHYAVRTDAIDPAQRQVWLARLQAAKLVE